jgi:serine phosphatase RsbU (regulator of sigma subunit)
MRQHLTGVPTAARAVARPVDWRSRWLEFSALVLLTVVLYSCLHRTRYQPPMLDPLLAVPPALAGIGAASVRRPLAYGGLSLLAAFIVALKPTAYAGWLPGTTMLTVAAITVVATAGTAVSVRQQRKIADVTSVAEAAQRALLRPPPARLGPLGLDVVYLAAAAEAKVGGDLYEVTRTADHGIRVIMGDVRGKGLGAVELAADVLGMFRELAHDAFTLAELADRLDTGLGRSLGRHEEFVTALLVEIDPESGRTSIYNCGHPAPLLIAAAAGGAATRVTSLEVPSPAPPLGLLSLGDRSRAQLSHVLQPDDQLLLYTDGITEARDAGRAFYPLPERVSALSATAAAAGCPTLVPPDGTAPRGLLDLVRADVLKHVGAPLDDDAALLLVRAPAAWPGARRTAPPAPPARVTA